ncbi:17092_t:CDS:2 [Cetraspora pellucida]|uniref:17092_t:CDS:1 n=1 Tax=Cetraspora pellucida TaxID=1433469 RepID=A0ACA9M8R1_9GLOM|nr:17092_t:CDS:2 [Cetraspora pellucida]
MKRNKKKSYKKKKVMHSDKQLNFKTLAESSKNNIKKQPFLSMQSISEQYKQFVAFKKDIKKELSALIAQHQLLPNREIKLSELNTIVQACNEFLMSQNCYYQLAAIEP